MAKIINLSMKLKQKVASCGSRMKKNKQTNKQKKNNKKHNKTKQTNKTKQKKTKQNKTNTGSLGESD